MSLTESDSYRRRKAFMSQAFAVAVPAGDGVLRAGAGGAVGEHFLSAASPG